MRISIRDLAGSEVAAGAPAGRAVLAQMLLHGPSDSAVPTRVFLDFSEVVVATASFLRESLFTYRNIVRRERPLLYPIVANAGELVRGEIAELVDLRRDVIVLCRLSEAEEAASFEILGRLDPKQALTFNLVRDRGEATAADLMHDYGQAEGTISPTAWNNRLSSLHSLGLVIEFQSGRMKRYQPIFTEIDSYGR